MRRLPQGRSVAFSPPVLGVSVRIMFEWTRLFLFDLTDLQDSLAITKAIGFDSHLGEHP